MRILVVDDDTKLVAVLVAYLIKEGYDVETAFDGLTALDKVQQFFPDLVLLDVMLPGMDGWSVCREIRRGSRVPVVMLTAMAGEDERVHGLDNGADDYITKPFSPREVMARIRAIFRRTQAVAVDHGRLCTGNIELNTTSHMLVVNGQYVDLTPTEYKLLELFMSHPNQAFSRLQLIEHVQADSYEGYERTIDSHIKNLRKKIGDSPGEPRYIQTVYGLGYKMAGDDRA